MKGSPTTAAAGEAGKPPQTIPVREAVEAAVRILKAHGAKRVILFGSAARSFTLKPEDPDETRLAPEPESEPRDLDLACEGLPPDRFFAILGELLATLPLPVDLVDLQGVELRPSLRERILREGVLLYEAN